MRHDIVCVGASAGGIETFSELVKGLPADFPAAILLVIHMSADFKSVLPEIISRRGSLPAVHAEDGAPIEAGRIYVAKPGYHFMIRKNGKAEISVGPKEMRFRPAINPLFRTAAAVFEERVIGIILSGLLEDGVSGLYEIKRHGGIAIVQDPDEAPFPGMPLSAISDSVKIDYILKVKDMAEKLVKLTKTGRSKAGQKSKIASKTPIKDRLTGLVCPACGGSLVERTIGGHPEYACHVGHTFSKDYLDRDYAEKLEEMLWSSLRVMQEMQYYYQDHASRITRNPAVADFYRRKAEQFHSLSENFKKQIPEIQTAAQMRIEEKELKSRRLSTPE